MQKSQIFRLCCILAAALLLGCVIVLYNVNISHTYKGHKLRLSSVGDDGVVMTDRDGGELVLTMDSHGYQPIELGGFAFTVRYRSEQLRFSDSSFFGEGPWVNTYTFSDGAQVSEDVATVTFSNVPEPESTLTPVQQEEKQLLWKLAGFVKRERPLSAYVFYAAIGLLMTLMGLGLLFYPVAFWRWRMSLWVDKGEPTDWAILANRIAGVALIIGINVALFRELL
jgi:hypothetical protein